MWSPDQYCARDEFRPPNEQRCPPHGSGPPWYPTLPRRVIVRDLAYVRLTPGERRFWYKAKHLALQWWSAAGVPLDTREIPGDVYKVGRITLDIADVADGTAGQADFGFMPGSVANNRPAPGVGWAHVDTDVFRLEYQSGMVRPMARLIAHELGHAFGFGHPPENRGGVMDTKWREENVSEEELALLAGYWRGGGEEVR